MKFQSHRSPHAKRRTSFSALVLLTFSGLLSLLVGSPSIAASPEPNPRIVFTKEFPNSQPDYFSISVGEDGQTIYRTAADDNAPLEFTLPKQTAAEIFRLAEKLEWFKSGKLESGRRVAFMGKKTIAYVKDEERHEATYNHTDLPEALALAAIFEKISTTEQHLLRLKYLIRFDRLGVVKELLQIEIDFDQGRLVGASQLLPILEQIEKDRSLVNVAKDRATQIIGKVKTEQY